MKRAIFAALLAVGLGGPTAWADDLFPAPWRDFTDPFYTIQEWEFTQPGTPLQPDGEITTLNPGDPAMFQAAGVVWDGNFQNTGLDGYFMPTGTGVMVFGIPNVVDNEPMKYLRIQINGIWDQSPPPVVSFISATKDQQPAVTHFIESDEAIPGFHRWEDWAIFPNPDDEVIQLIVPGGSFVNQVVIETISFPEPASLSLLTLGGLVALRRRRA